MSAHADPGAQLTVPQTAATPRIATWTARRVQAAPRGFGDVTLRELRGAGRLRVGSAAAK